MKSSWGADLFRSLFAAIDSAVYGLIAVVYEILINITKVDIFGEGAIETMGQKIYTFLVVFMLFKITFSFISYLVNPDSLTDNAKGAQKIILHVLLVLVMIMISPIAFQKLKEAQNAILTDQVIPKFILGTNSESIGNLNYKMSEQCSEESYAKTDGNYIALLVFRPFFQPDSTVGVLPPDYCRLGNVFTGIYGSAPAYLSTDIVNYDSNKKYAIDYKIGMTTIVGLVVLLIIVSFCFDIAVRAIKLGFLELIAPIPIISYVDPKSGKDGMFKKWLKEVGRTWADLFIRLTALFFAVFVIQLTQSDQMFAQVSEYKFWVVLFIIIGALMFAKKLPKLIEDILGIKLGGDLTLNPLKKIRENALGGKQLVKTTKGAAALTAGAALGVAANATNLGYSIKTDGLKKALMGKSTGFKGGMRAVGTVLGVGAGGVSAGLHGAHSAYKNDAIKKGVKQGLKTSVDNRDNRDKTQDIQYSFFAKGKDKLKGMAGIKTEAKIRSEQAQSEVARLQAAQQSISYQQQRYMMDLTTENISNLSNITVEKGKDEHGNTVDYYSFTDQLGKKREINGQTSWDLKALKALFNDANANVIGKINNMNSVMEYATLQARKNALDKDVFASMKIQKLFTEKDAEAKKS